MTSALPVLHSTNLPAGHKVPAFEPYAPQRLQPPPWMKHPQSWERAIAIYQEPINETAVLIHRDYHPGNVLWRRGAVSGVVDWRAASIGPASIDAGWCRLQLLLEYGWETAKRFTHHWQHLSGSTYHPAAAEVALLVDLLGETHLRPPRHADTFAALLDRALADY